MSDNTAWVTSEPVRVRLFECCQLFSQVSQFTYACTVPLSTYDQYLFVNCNQPCCAIRVRIRFVLSCDWEILSSAHGLQPAVKPSTCTYIYTWKSLRPNVIQFSWIHSIFYTANTLCKVANNCACGIKYQVLTLCTDAAVNPEQHLTLALTNYALLQTELELLLLYCDRYIWTKSQPI